jgi:hypothetical protein
MHKDRRLPSLGDRCFEIHRPDAGTQLELNPFVGNSESNLYSLMKVNPFHSEVPGLFEAVAKTPLPELPPGVAPELPIYPLPDPVPTFDSLLSSPDIYFQNPQTWSLGPMEVRERRFDPGDEEDWEGLEDWLEYGELPPVPMEPLVPPLPPLIPGRGGNGNDTQVDKRAEGEAKAKEQQMAQEMWMQWINFSPSQSQKSSADSNKSNKSTRSTRSTRSNDNDTHMSGTSVGPRSGRRRAGTGTGAGVEQRGTKHRGKNR